HVTGVQTCALPIYARAACRRGSGHLLADRLRVVGVGLGGDAYVENRLMVHGDLGGTNDDPCDARDRGWNEGKKGSALGGRPSAERRTGPGFTSGYTVVAANGTGRRASDGATRLPGSGD